MTVIRRVTRRRPFARRHAVYTYVYVTAIVIKASAVKAIEVSYAGFVTAGAALRLREAGSREIAYLPVRIARFTSASACLGPQALRMSRKIHLNSTVFFPRMAEMSCRRVDTVCSVAAAAAR